MTPEGQNRRFYAGSKYFSDIENPNEKSLRNLKSRTDYFLQSDSYGPVVFDKYRRCYYRIAFQGIKKDHLKQAEPDKREIKQASVIIIDSTKNVVGEVLLPRYSYTETYYFVSEEGLNLANWSASKNNEDSLYFDVFVPERI